MTSSDYSDNDCEDDGDDDDDNDDDGDNLYNQIPGG